MKQIRSFFEPPGGGRGVFDRIAQGAEPPSKKEREEIIEWNRNSPRP